jgi:hypothetical protein
MLDRKIELSIDNGLITLTDEELDAVAAGVTVVSFTAKADITGKLGATAVGSLELTQTETKIGIKGDWTSSAF